MGRTLKVVILTPEDPNDETPNLRALREAKALEEAGHNYWLVWVEAHHPPLGRSLARARSFWRMSKELARRTIAYDPDIIIAHDVYTLLGGMMATTRLKIPLLYDSHESWPELIGENSRIERFMATRLERWAPIDHVFAPCEPVAKRFSKRGIPTTVLHNARSSQDINLTPGLGAAFRAKAGFTDDDFVVGYIGSMQQLKKGNMTDVLINTLKKMPAYVKAIIIGGPDDDAAELNTRMLREGLYSQVSVEGQRNFSELAGAYQAIDLGLILLDERPNYKISLPNKLFDYMAFGIPVLAPPYPEIEKVIWDSGAGWIMTHPRVFSGLLYILATHNHMLHKTFGDNGRRAFLERYAWEHQAKKVVTVCESFISKT